MLESKDMTNVPVIVVANKVDLVATKNYVAPLHPKVSQQHFYIQHLQQQAETGNNLVSGGLTNALSSTLLSVNGTLANGASNIQGYILYFHPKGTWPFESHNFLQIISKKSWLKYFQMLQYETAKKSAI